MHLWTDPHAPTCAYAPVGACDAWHVHGSNNCATIC